jgi:menaquinone-dependent protoporphyrinogen oxidase
VKGQDMSKILVAYASKHGSTGEIAQTIGESLRELGHQVDVFDVEAVKNISAYQAIVLGSAVYAGRWMKEAVSFLRTHQVSDTPLYIFSSGPIGDDEPQELLDGFTLPEVVKTLIQPLKVRDIQVFHGKIDIRKLSIAELMLFKSVGAQTGDYRKWDRIKAWAQKIGNELAQAQN